MYLPAPRSVPLNATEIGLLHKVDHALTVLLETEREAEIELGVTQPTRTVTEPNPAAHCVRPQTGRLHRPQTGPLRAS